MFVLKNCPKCGGKALVIQDWCYPPMYWIRCKNCNKATHIHKYLSNAVYEWNGYIKGETNGKKYN